MREGETLEQLTARGNGALYEAKGGEMFGDGLNRCR